MIERSSRIRSYTVAGFVGGTVIGFLVSPRLHYRLRHFGLDQVAFYPAALIILACSLAGAFLARRRAMRMKV